MAKVLANRKNIVKIVTRQKDRKGGSDRNNADTSDYE